ncbi:TonB-dependent receptor [Lampropedia puyangensis]|uniref:TonB-dependent receptor n=1 Tax=Lampropedia puyangensis TaxID=1330072 RepID=A0A4S8F7U4_9BURK|nr:TonB-dependent receptor [Lampropedia puyangensis]THU03683.1 TonB-dependent receptor [Lampropedia puyangensis]
MRSYILNIRSKTVALAVLCLLTGLSHAQESRVSAAQNQGDEEMPAVVVTASGAEQLLEDAPASISVISAQELQRKPVQELAEVLGGVEGVTLNRSGTGEPRVQIRGLGADYTLILIDGKRVNASSVNFRGNDYDTGWVPVSEIERIEVVRGPMSSLYGSDAIGGVINIITKKVSDHWRGHVRMDTIQQAKRSAGDTYAGSFSLAGPIKPNELGIKVYGSYDLRKADQDSRETESLPVHPVMRNSRLGSQLSWTPVSDQTFTLDMDASRRDHDHFVLKRQAVALNHKGRWGVADSDLTLSTDRIRNETGVVSGQTNPATAHTYALNGKLNIPLSEWNQRITVGAEVRHENLKDSTNLGGWPGAQSLSDGKASVGQQALFIEDEIYLGDDWQLTLGNRIDHHEHFGVNHSPRAYVVWRASPDVRVKGGVARSFRAPTLLQNSPQWGSVSCGSATEGCYIVGSKSLKPETGTSVELGISAALTEKVQADVTLFRTRLKNMISIDNRTRDPVEAQTYPNFVGLLPDGRPVLSYENVASVQTQGVEASVKTQWSDAFDFRLNYTFTKAEDTSGSTAMPLTYRPRHSASLAMNWHRGPWTAGADWRFTGRQVTNAYSKQEKGSYSNWDLNVGWEIAPQWAIKFGVLNALNKQDARDADLSYLEDGRRYFLSLEARF